MADYDLNEIAAALSDALKTNGWTIDGQLRKVAVYDDVPGQVSVPAIAIELDDVVYNETFGRGSDAFVFLAYLLVSSADTSSGQKLVRALLSSNAVSGIVDALEQDTTLGQLVSYAVLAGTRSIGTINYGNVSYYGAVLEIGITPIASEG